MQVRIAATKIRSIVKSSIGPAARSPWMSVAAAVAVVLGTSGTYISGSIDADVRSCDVHRELLIANGSPELRAYRDAVPQITNAQAYIALAMSTRDQERRREYAYLGIAAANGAIMKAPLGREGRVDLISYPDEIQLASPNFMKNVSNRIYNLDVTQLLKSLKIHDGHMIDQISELYKCKDLTIKGEVYGLLGTIFTLISVILIGLREVSQAKREK